MFTIEIQGQIFNLQLLHVLNTNQIINNIFQNDKYIKYSQTNIYICMYIYMYIYMCVCVCV